MFYVFHGEDAFSRDAEIARLRAKAAVGDPAMAELNTNVLDGAKLTFGELRHTCDAIPFLTAIRLVLVHGLLGRLAPAQKAGDREAPSEPEPAWKRAFLEELVAYLPQLPNTTLLVFVERELLPPSHRILKLVQTEGKTIEAYVKAFPLPKGPALAGWIQAHAEAAGGHVGRDAAEMLAALVGPDLHLLDQEIDKLLLYVDGGRPVSAGDVRALVSRARETSIFDLVDSVGRRQTDRALQLLHHLLDEGEPPLQILSMIARQIRVLMQVGELRGQGLSPQEIAGRLKLHPFVVGKALDQVPNFSPAQLETAHRRVVEADWTIKTGAAEEVLALDLLVVRLAEG